MARLLASSRRLRRASVSVAAGRSARSARPVNARCSRARCAWASRTLPAPPREQRAGGDVLQHRHLRERLHDLEGAREAEPRDLVRPHARDVAGRRSAPGPRSAGCTPVMRLISVVLPAPFGPIRPTISPCVDREADTVDGVQAAEPARHLVEFEQRRHRDPPRRAAARAAAAEGRSAGTAPARR